MPNFVETFPNTERYHAQGVYLHLAISWGDIDCVPSDRPFGELGGHDGLCNILLSGHGLLWWVSRRTFVIEPVTIQNQPLPDPKWPKLYPNPSQIRLFSKEYSLILNRFLIMSGLLMLKLVSPVLCFQCVHSLIRFCDFFAVPQKLREIFARKSDHCQLWSRWDRRFCRRRRIPTNGPFSRYQYRCSRMSSWRWWRWR